MKNSNYNNLTIVPLSDHEISQINGGCEGIPCLGLIVGAVQNFWSGVVAGFDAGVKAAQRTM